MVAIWVKRIKIIDGTTCLRLERMLHLLKRCVAGNAIGSDSWTREDDVRQYGLKPLLQWL